jgi:uncharacterized membrane protein YfcA
VTGGQLALASAAGLIGGFVNAIAGGGSLFLFPALVAGGLGTVAANVTNAVALWPGYLGNVLALGTEHQAVRRQWSIYPVTVCGAGGGCALLLLTPVSAFTAVVPFLVIGASLLLATQQRIKNRLGDRVAGDHPAHLRVGVFAGSVYGGYFGGGLGVIFMAVLGVTLSAPLARVNTLKGTLQLLVATVTLLVFAIFGPVQWVIAAIVAPLSLIGGVLGGRLARRLSEPVLRGSVVAFGVVVGVWLAARAFS